MTSASLHFHRVPPGEVRALKKRFDPCFLGGIKGEWTTLLPSRLETGVGRMRREWVASRSRDHQGFFLWLIRHRWMFSVAAWSSGRLLDEFAVVSDPDGCRVLRASRLPDLVREMGLPFDAELLREALEGTAWREEIVEFRRREGISRLGCGAMIGASPGKQRRKPWPSDWPLVMPNDFQRRVADAFGIGVFQADRTYSAMQVSRPSGSGDGETSPAAN